MKDVFYFELDGQKYEYHVKDDVTFSDLLAAIGNGFNMCFMDDGSYHPELFDFAKEYTILATLTDIALPDTADGVYRIVRAIDGVCSVDADFIMDGMIEKAKFHEKLLVATAQNYHTQRIADMAEILFGKVNQIVDTVSSLLDNVGKQVESGELGDIQKLLSDLANAKGMTPEDMVAGMLKYKDEQKKPAKKKRTVKKVDDEE